MKKSLYVIPGTMCDEMLWHRLKPELNDEFELVHLSIPIADSMDGIAEKLIKLLPDADINLLGFSFGGYLASFIATKMPERIQHLLVVSNSPCQLSDRELAERKKNVELIHKYGYRGISHAKALSMLDPNHPDDDLVSIIIEMDKNMGLASLINQLTVGSDRQNLEPALLAAPFDIRFIFNQNDKFVNKDWIANFVSHKPNSEAYAVEGAGHMLPLEHPKALAKILIQYL